MRFVPLRLGWLLLLSLGLTGCPKTGTIRGANGTPKQMIASIIQKRQAIKSLEGRAKLRIYRPNKRRQTLRMYFQLQRPNRIHLSVIAAAMQPILVVTCDGKEFAMHNIAQGQFIKGSASQLPRLLGDFLPTHIPLKQLIAALLGELPILDASKEEVADGKKKNVIVVSLSSANHTQKVWFDRGKSQFLKTQLKVKKKPPLTLEYGTYRGKPALPKRIKFIMPQRKRRVHWIFSQQDINPKIPLKSFRQTPPKGAKVQVLR